MVSEIRNEGVIKVYNNKLEYIEEITPKERATVEDPMP